VLLVDNAAQPMQAAPVAALKGIAVSGNASKLHVIFTHFDQVKGNSFSDREQHVLASVENVLKSIGDELGPVAERVLRRRIDQERFFVGGIQDPLDAKKKAGSRSIQQLDAAPEPLGGPRTRRRCRPEPSVFNRMNPSLAVMEAAKTVHTRWQDLVDTEIGGHGVGDLVGVAGDHHYPPAEPVQLLDGLAGLGADRVLQRECPDDLVLANYV
jgi:hypothetical protein